MSQILWKVLKFLPQEWLMFVKHNTSAQLRYFIRQRMGADYRNIPDTILTIKDGRKFHIGPDWIYWSIYHGLGYEPEITDIVDKLVRPQDVVLDIGANFGWYSTLFAKKYQNNVEVHSFEPAPSTFNTLTENIKLNNIEQGIHLNQIALSDRPGTTQIHIFTGRSHAVASISTLDEEEYDSFEVDVSTLDRYLESNNIDRVNFAKIDVEGNELFVLKGAANILRKEDAPILTVEVNNDTFTHFNYTAEDVWNLLREYDYDMFYAIVNSSTLAPIYDPKDLMDLSNVVMPKPKDENKLDKSSIKSSFKVVPAYIICAKKNVIQPRIETAGIKVSENFFN
jgi:FkbM family methyltransferase